jgi:hypothetical protein
LLVANLTPREQEATVAPVSGKIEIRRLNEETAEQAAWEPERFRAAVERQEASGELSLRFSPFETVRVDVAG